MTSGVGATKSNQVYRYPSQSPVLLHTSGPTVICIICYLTLISGSDSPDLTDVLTARTDDSMGRYPPSHNVSHSPVRTTLSTSLIPYAVTMRLPGTFSRCCACLAVPEDPVKSQRIPCGYLICGRYRPICFHRAAVVILYVLGFFYQYTWDPCCPVHRQTGEHPRIHSPHEKVFPVHQ